MDGKVKCDKPYDLDAADKRRGKPRRRRKDSHTTAYELTIRFDEEQRAVMGGKRKTVRVVYARNKKEDLAGQIDRFEHDVGELLRSRAVAQGALVDGSSETVSSIMRRYIKAREPSVTERYTKDSLFLTERYIDPTIGDVAFDDLTIAQIADALDSIPEISRRLNEGKRERQIVQREKKIKELKAGPREKRHGYPEFKAVRVAGMPIKHRVLQLLKNAGNYAEDMELIKKNVAANKRLAKQYPKAKARLDNWSPEESKQIYAGIRSLPLCAKKIEFQLFFMCGLRPCEVLEVKFADMSLDSGRPYLHVVRRMKTSNAYRPIKLDRETACLLRDWRDNRKRFAEQAGLKFSDSWLVCCDDGQKAVYNTFKQRWMYFLEKLELEHRRPYSIRHTFATNNAKRVDAKTLAGVMGHANAGFTLSEYAGYYESSNDNVTDEYLDFLESENGYRNQ